jgi:fatty acid synthase subunit beta, fungi type
MGSSDIIERLVRMVTTEMVDWPKVCSVLDGTHLLDFGPGRIGGLVHQTTEGTGLRVIVASELAPFSRNFGNKSEIFSSIMPPSAPNWGELFRPTLTRDSTGEVKLDTKMSRLFGVPPVMVSGMTPTTVPWDFVAAVMKAGYHVELAGGGYINASAFEAAIRKVSENVPAGCGITCNLIYASPKTMSWQIPLIRGLIRKGVQIEGLTIGACVPSAEVANEYIETLGLKHISFKPGSYESILHVVSIAKAHPDFTIGLQWTGGRSGGHHSFEDFHAPILATYGRIRECSNIVLIAGGGFGDASDTYPYMTGEWSRALGYPSMPFDGILLGSRMMVAKEAHTSSQAKSLIVQAEGVRDSQWHKSYKQPTGGVITVNSEMGQPIHKLATRGVLSWHDLDKKIFSIKDQSKRLAELEKCKTDIIERLRNDFQKPWFAVNSVGQSVDIEDMTYAEVLERLVSLMYVSHQSRWIDPSYEKLVLDWTVRTQERLAPVSDFKGEKGLDDPYEFMAAFTICYPTAETELLHPEDVSFFIGLCKRRGQKPVNFIPRLDESFEHWFKKDSLWQAEDIDAVFDQDAQRVCIIHGPVAARYSKVVDETSQSILDGIAKSHVDMLRRDFYPNDGDLCDEMGSASDSDLEDVYVEELPPQTIYQIPTSGPIPDTDSLIAYLLGDTAGWAHACLADKTILQGQHRQQNPIRSAFTPYHGYIVTINYRAGREVASVSLSTSRTATEPSRDLLRMISSDGTHVSVTLFEPNPHGNEDIGIEFKFDYHQEMRGCRLSEDMEHRNERIKAFYARLWLGEYPPALMTAGLDTEFSGGKVTLSRKMVQDFMSVIGASDPSQSMQEYTDEVVPMDVCIAVAWDGIIII